MEHLRALQTLELSTRRPTPSQRAQILKLRELVPAPILSHFDRLIVRGKKGVARARNGACGECHLRIASGTMQALSHANEIHICDNCGRYLYLPEDAPLDPQHESLPADEASTTRPRRARGEAVAAAA